MSNPRLTLLPHHESALRSWLQGHPDGHERAAVVLMRRFRHHSKDLPKSDRYQVIEVHPIDDAVVTSSGPGHVDFPTAHIRHLMQACEERNLSLGFVHSHPSGYTMFSGQDSVNELSLLQGLSNRNGPKVSLLALMLCDGQWYGRVRHASDPENAIPLRHILVIGEKLQLHLGEGIPEAMASDVWARQCAAFGEPFQRQLASLRIGVVGVGGTGSPTYTMLTRAGVLELVFIDPDVLVNTNLNRVRGARLADVGRPKVEIARDFVYSLDLGTQVHLETGYVDSCAASVDALLCCDIVIGCTDDFLGRAALNALAYRHGVVVVDMGIGGAVAPAAASMPNAPLRFYQHGRITTLLPGVPGYRCMVCEGIYNAEQLREAEFHRNHPDATEQQKMDAYIKGGNTQAPGIGPFTSALADYALMQLYDLLLGFRLGRIPPEVRRGNYFIDFVSMSTCSMAVTQEECPLCHTANGSTPLGLLKDNSLRLGRPSLDELPRHELPD